MDLLKTVCSVVLPHVTLIALHSRALLVNKFVAFRTFHHVFIGYSVKRARNVLKVSNVDPLPLRCERGINCLYIYFFRTTPKFSYKIMYISLFFNERPDVLFSRV